ncbi:MAG TPA: iron chelate uptake ABC transporter family permease subunit [Pseudonocardia sp.]|uniref:FecCD family ABC transporter permease n=1 Tax=Pseudonocardia sp. TaxID=60912 RepID=UPI002B4B52F1|nr:iron chelate uptake ABC transporter family permease subunit [Pseudonocardia sp.]HLU60052.1 iron chelate uptake ABC transporter family permease subunit [Pseudonocardia sp.]
MIGLATRRRPRAAPAVAALAVIVATGLSLLVGIQPVTPADLVAALADPGAAGSAVVVHLRVPRTAAGLLAGAGLGLAGAVAQGLTRNPLAGPEVLGVNGGAAFAGVVALALVGVEPLGGYVWFCFAGAALALAAVLAIASAGRGGATPGTIAVVGAAVSALLFSLTSAVVLRDHDLFERFRFFLVGSLARADLATVAQAVPFLAAGTALALALARPLDAAALGDDAARAVGARPALLRAVAVGAIVVLAGTATAVAGPVAFVGLVVPHAARILVGPAHVRLLPLSALLGALVLLLADVVGRVVVRPEEVQVGVTAAVLGGPVFLYLVRRRRVPQP